MKSLPRYLRAGPRVAVIGLVAAVALGEIGLRVFSDYGRTRMAETSARHGYRLVPNQVVRGDRGTTERINSRGYRDGEWGAPGADGGAAVRVAVLGNSVPYGVGVEDDEVWPRRLEAGLRERLGEAREVEVLNFAVPGYVVEQMVRICEDEVLSFRPQVVVLCVGLDGILPMTPREDPVRYPGHRLVRRSALWDCFDLNVRRRAELAQETEVRNTQRRVRSAPYAPEQQELWDAVFVALDRLVPAVEEAGARLVVLENPLLVGVLHPETVPDSMSWSGWAGRHAGVVHLTAAPALRTAMAELLAEIEAAGLHPRDFWNRDFPGLHRLEHGGQAAFFEDAPYHLSPFGHSMVAEAVLAGLIANELL